MPFGCICLESLQAGTLANAYSAPVPAHAWPQIHSSDFSFTPTYGPRAPFPQMSQGLAWCLESIQIWTFPIWTQPNKKNLLQKSEDITWAVAASSPLLPRQGRTSELGLPLPS